MSKNVESVADRFSRLAGITGAVSKNLSEETQADGVKTGPVAEPPVGQQVDSVVAEKVKTGRGQYQKGRSVVAVTLRGMTATTKETARPTNLTWYPSFTDRLDAFVELIGANRSKGAMMLLNMVMDGWEADNGITIRQALQTARNEPSEHKFNNI